MRTGVDRREFLQRGLLGAGAVVLAPALAACKPGLPGPSFPILPPPTPPNASDLCVPEGPYGPLVLPEGILLPEGFTSRVVARAGQAVADSDYVWHVMPDGGACFDQPDGGWIYVSNSETTPSWGGGASSIRFGPDGSIISAQRICGGTSMNCAGGPTPWGTWLSCEEKTTGQVYECSPLGEGPAVVRPGMGTFKHEAAACDPATDTVYLTEDVSDGCFYRFRHAPEDLSDGVLEVAEVDPGGAVTWHVVPDPGASEQHPRYQVEPAARFNRGEGAWFALGAVYFATTGDDRVWRYDPSTDELRILYDAQTSCNPVLTDVDNLTVSNEGDIYVCEDPAPIGDFDLKIVMLGRDGEVAPFLELVGHEGSEITGVAFNPRGDRMYFSSQRGDGQGITYEVTGPFRDAIPADD